MATVLLVAMTVRITVTAEEGRYILVETKRIFSSGREQRNRRDYVSETRKPFEDERKAAIRALWEECGFEVGKDQLKAQSQPRMLTEAYPSSAYNGLLTIAVIDWYRYELTRRPWRTKKHVDRGTQIYHRFEKVSRA